MRYPPGLAKLMSACPGTRTRWKSLIWWVSETKRAAANETQARAAMSRPAATQYHSRDGRIDDGPYMTTTSRLPGRFSRGGPAGETDGRPDYGCRQWCSGETRRPARPAGTFQSIGSQPAAGPAAIGGPGEGARAAEVPVASRLAGCRAAWSASAIA